MNIDFSAVIKDLDGNPVPHGNNKDMTLAVVACAALMHIGPDDQNLSADEKVKRFRLAQAAVDGGVQDVPISDVALLKTLINRLYGPLVVGRAYDIIEPPKSVVAEKAA